MNNINNFTQVRPEPFLQNGPFSLENQAASNVVTYDLQNSPSANIKPSIRDAVNRCLIEKWTLLKWTVPQYLRDMMFRIEDSVDILATLDDGEIEKHKMGAILNIPTDAIELELEKNVNSLFQKLAKKLDAKKTFDDVIPVDPVARQTSPFRAGSRAPTA